MMPIWITIGLGFVFIFWAVSIYNSLVTFKKRYENAFKQIDVQLERRYDLIPNLMEACKGYMKHESETLNSVIAARNNAKTARDQASNTPGDSNALKNLLGAESVLGSAMGGFYAVAEGYPDLKANTNIAQLMEELSTTENKIAFARQAFNDAVTKFNITRAKFPNVLIAAPCNFNEAALYELQQAEKREAVKVSF